MSLVSGRWLTLGAAVLSHGLLFGDGAGCAGAVREHETLVRRGARECTETIAA